ncbi:MAG: GDP-mannose 4,6-dehydratase [Chloroflexi bacterium]|nr:GDP-mannose 4,6-dehydratase [Chloroflexota bacterium]
MTVALVTGAAGFVGRHLSAHLVRAGVEVHGLDVSLPPAGWPWPWHTVDVLNASALGASLDRIKPDYVLHVAALLRSPALADLMNVNVIGTDNLLAAVAECCPQARVLVTGSSAEYGLVTDGELPISESCALRPLSPYGVSKAAQSLLAAQYAVRRGLAVVRTRAFNLTGPGEPPEQVISAMARQFAEFERRQGEHRLRVGNLNTMRDFCDARDAVRGYWLVAQKGEPGEVYNVCSGRETAVRAVLDRLAALTGISPLVHSEPGRMTPWDVPRQVGDGRKLEQLAGFEPEIPWDQTLLDLLNDWRRKLSQ